MIVERKDIDRLRRNKDNNGCMIEPALTKNTNDYTYNHFKNVDKRGRQIRGALKSTSRDKVQRVKGIKSLMLFTTVKVSSCIGLLRVSILILILKYYCR